MATVNVHLLDEFFVESDGARLVVGGPRPRALIARLALERGRSLSLDLLIDDLWDTGSAETRTTLRAYMSRLRSTALGPWLSGGRTGYRLVDGPGLSVDLWALDDAIARASSLDDRLARDVLSRWRNAPLQAIGEPPFAEPARARIRR
ncbi:MAG TPA: hypothetical protein VN241_00340, partial [Microbacterium sp.]|nr:hypothetical protein [Microbacterium sp.]